MVRTINRRDLNQRSGQILDEVLASGEPVRVVGRDGRAVLITADPEGVYERWKAAGLVRPATRRPEAEPERQTTASTVEEIMDDLRGDR
jgi:hypothetical protein